MQTEEKQIQGGRMVGYRKTGNDFVKWQPEKLEALKKYDICGSKSRGLGEERLSMYLKKAMTLRKGSRFEPSTSWM